MARVTALMLTLHELVSLCNPLLLKFFSPQIHSESVHSSEFIVVYHTTSLLDGLSFVLGENSAVLIVTTKYHPTFGFDIFMMSIIFTTVSQNRAVVGQRAIRLHPLLHIYCYQIMFAYLLVCKDFLCWWINMSLEKLRGTFWEIANTDYT